MSDDLQAILPQFPRLQALYLRQTQVTDALTAQLLADCSDMTQAQWDAATKDHTAALNRSFAMGYDQHQQSGSSGTLVAIAVAAIAVPVLLVVGLGIVALIGAGVAIWQDFGGVPQVAVVEQQAAVELHNLEEIELDGSAQLRLQESSVVASPVETVSIDVQMDREGNASVDGEGIGLDELRAQLAKLKDETNNAFYVQINADSECPVKHVVAVVAVCDDVGDIDYRITSSEDSAVRMTATVASYEPAAEWDHFDDGTFSAYDKLTLQVVAPERYASTTFSVTVLPTEFPEDSAFRTTGTRFTFMMRESYIGTTGLAWGAIGDPAIEQ